MANIDAVLNQQREIGERIKSRAQAFANLAVERKSREYLSERLQRLDTDWATFVANDLEINNSQIELSHNYFSSKYYEAIESITIEYRKDIMAHLEELNRHKGQIGSENEPVDPAIIKSALNQDPAQMLKVMKESVINLERTIAEYHQKEQFMQKTESSVVRKMIIKKWDLVSDLHGKVMLTPGYDFKAYYGLENNMAVIMMKTQDEKSNGLYTKLPKLELPKFKGEPLKWEPFQQLFMQMVDRQDSLSDAEKLAYLKGQLEGEPARLIQALPVIEASYKAA